MFAGTIFCIVMVYFLWRWKLRLAYIEHLYNRGDSKLLLSKEISREELMIIADMKLNYPAKAGVRFDAEGNVELLGLYGDYSIRLNGLNLKVEAGFPAEQRTPKEPDEEDIYEEAICIKKYFQQYFYRDSGINLEAEFNKLCRSVKTRRTVNIIGIIIQVAIVLMVLYNVIWK